MIAKFALYFSSLSAYYTNWAKALNFSDSELSSESTLKPRFLYSDANFYLPKRGKFLIHLINVWAIDQPQCENNTPYLNQIENNKMELPSFMSKLIVKNSSRPADLTCKVIWEKIYLINFAWEASKDILKNPTIETTH